MLDQTKVIAYVESSWHTLYERTFVYFIIEAHAGTWYFFYPWRRSWTGDVYLATKTISPLYGEPVYVYK